MSSSTPSTTSYLNDTASTSEFIFEPFLAIQLDIGSRLSSAQALGVIECLRAQGFEVDLPIPAGSGNAPSSLESRYSIADRDELAVFGYGSSAAVRSESNESGVDLDDPALQAALYGSSAEPAERIDLLDTDDNVIGSVSQPGGCVGSAQASIFGSFADYARFLQLVSLIEEMALDSYQEAQASPEMNALDGRWYSCMSALGYDGFRSPIEARNADWRVETDAVSPEEIAVAVADFDCQTEIGYPREAQAIETSLSAPKADQFAVYWLELQPMLDRLGAG